jgi:tetratricopeptide (TPR) repeat protein
MRARKKKTDYRDLPLRARLAMVAQGKKSKCGLSKTAARYATPEAELERERLLGPNPWAGFNHNNIACELLRMGSVQLAIAEFEKAVALNPWEASFRINLARAYIRAGEFEKAGLNLAEAARKEPLSPEGFFAGGLLCEATGKPREAALYYEKCLKYCPEGIIRNQAVENLAVVRRMKK